MKQTRKKKKNAMGKNPDEEYQPVSAKLVGAGRIRCTSAKQGVAARPTSKACCKKKFVLVVVAMVFKVICSNVSLGRTPSFSNLHTISRNYVVG
jgi:hypothetical protein